MCSGGTAPAAVLVGVLLGFALTSVCAAALALAGRLKPGDRIAHEPGMLAATLAVTIAAGVWIE